MFGSLSFVLALDLLALTESDEATSEAEKEASLSRALGNVPGTQGELNKAKDEPK